VWFGESGTLRLECDTIQTPLDLPPWFTNKRAIQAVSGVDLEAWARSMDLERATSSQDPQAWQQHVTRPARLFRTKLLVVTNPQQKSAGGSSLDASTDGRWNGESRAAFQQPDACSPVGIN